MSSIPLRIAYFGLPLGALALAASGFRPRIVALGHTDTPGARRVRRVLSQRGLVLGRPQLEDPEVVRVLASVQPDVILSWFWPKRIPEAVLGLAPRGAFGVHPSLLPRWRGPDPYFWAIEAGDTTTGVSLHRLERDYDTGAVIAQERVTIAAHDTAWTLAKRLDRPGLRLLVDCARRLTAGETLAGTPQDAAAVTPAPAPDDALLCIDWSQPAAHVVRRVRALSPQPGATAELSDQQVEVLAAEAFSGSLPRALVPGDAVLAPAGVVVRAGDAGVLLGAVRTEEGSVLRGPRIAQLFGGALSVLPANSGKLGG